LVIVEREASIEEGYVVNELITSPKVTGATNWQSVDSLDPKTTDALEEVTTDHEACCIHAAHNGSQIQDSVMVTRIVC
jgi:hypothetical protein